MQKPDDFVAGDDRAQSLASLLSVHVLWHREHNRIARKLAPLIRPKGTQQNKDELLYQVINIREYMLFLQVICY